MTDEEKEVNTFCVTKPSVCTMNYCDENGCQDRERNLTEAGEKTFELFVSIYPPFRACFRIGVQTFSVCDRVEKKEAEWFVERLRTAFQTLEEDQTKSLKTELAEVKRFLQELNYSGNQVVPEIWRVRMQRFIK